MSGEDPSPVGIGLALPEHPHAGSLEAEVEASDTGEK